ncbi:MAG: hypothetical protein WCJ23_06520 [Verrucomicrobiota bacterium]
MSIRGARGADEHYGFMHNVEMWGWGEELAQVGFRVGYDIPKNVGMTMQGLKGKGGVSVFEITWRPWRIPQLRPRRWSG